MSVTADHRGFVWLASIDGFIRFDGKHFRKYFRPMAAQPTTGTNRLYSIIEVRHGLLLGATRNGLLGFNSLTGQFVIPDFLPEDLREGSDTWVNALFKDSKGRTWIAHQKGIDVLDSLQQHCERITDSGWAKHATHHTAIYDKWQEDSNGRLWMTTTLGTQVIDITNKSVWNSKNNPENLPFLIAYSQRAVYNDEAYGQVWYAPWAGDLRMYESKTRKTTIVKIPHATHGEGNSVNRIFRLGDQIQILSGTGWFEVDRKKMTLKKIALPGLDSNIFPVFGYLKHQSQQWMFSNQGGLLQVSTPDDNLQVISFPWEILYANVDIVQYNQDDYYLSYWRNGMVKLNRPSSKATPINGQSKDAGIINFMAVHGKTIFTSAVGISQYSPSTGKFDNRLSKDPFFQTNTVQKLLLNKKGLLFFSTSGHQNAVGFYDTKTDELTILPAYIKDGKSIYDSTKVIGQMAEDEAGNVWMTANGGKAILEYEVAGKQWKSYPHEAFALLRNWHPEYMPILPLSGKIWLGGNAGGGLVCLDLVRGSAKHFGTASGLSSNNVTALVADKSGNIFVATDNGIDYLNTKDGSIRNASFPAHLWNESPGNILYDTFSNQLLIALSNKAIWAKEQLWANSYEGPNTFIDGIKANNTTIPIVPGRNATATLAPGSTNIDIAFVAIDYATTEPITYAYRLKGRDTKWDTVYRTNQVLYTSLPPGEYTFEVKAKTLNSAWSPPATVKLLVQPHVWQKPWFLITAAILSTALLYWIVSRRIKTLRKEAAMKNKLLETEIRALRSQMNPHFIFNSINAIDNLIQTDQKTKATTYLNRFAKLMRKVLESSQHNLVPFADDYDALLLYLQLEQYRSGDKFSFVLHADEMLMSGDYKVPPLLVQPLLENAILHGLLNKQHGDRNLHVDIRLVEDQIVYTIEDNGIGRLQAARLKENIKLKHHSYGMAITVERLRLHNTQSKEDGIVYMDRNPLEENPGTIVKVAVDVKEED